MDGANLDTSIAWPELVFSLSSPQEESLVSTAAVPW